MKMIATAVSELVSISSKDSAACTRVLTQWKLHLIPAASIEEILQLFDCSESKDSVLPTLLAIINDELPFVTTEGHRESSVEILRSLLQHAFGQQKDYVGSNLDRIDILQSLFLQCSSVFERRMSRQDSSDHRGFHGSSLSSQEQSEHIRLSLVELMSELGSYLMHKHQGVEMESIFEAASCICQTLANHVFNDPFPDILAASCTLVQSLTKLCPSAVQLNAKDLLLQLAGKEVKHCLFRNRRSKIRSQAVETSSAIVLCQASPTSSKIGEHDGMLDALQNILLPGWEELIKMDTSVSVRVAAINAAGMTAKQFDWTYSPSGENRDLLTSGKETDQIVELTSLVESNVLSLFVLGVSDGNTEVQESAIQQMISSLKCGSQHGQGNIPWDAIARYFPAILELILASCSLPWSTCQGRVRSLEALQVLLSIATAILDSRVVEDQCSLTLLSSIQPVIECLRQNIVSEEKNVMQAALTASSILGGSNACSTHVLDKLILSSENQFELSKDANAMISSPREAASTVLLLSRMVKGLICNDEAAAILRRVDPSLSMSAPNWIYTSSSAMTTITTLLSHTSVTKGVSVHPSLAWALLDAVSEVVKCCKHHLSVGEDDNDDSWTLKEESVLEILVGIVHLLGCPESHGLSAQAAGILQEFSSFFTCDADSDSTKRSLLDVHFCKLVPKIMVDAESAFPWKESDAAFIAMTALLGTVQGATVSSNFDLVAPFLIHHMPSTEITKDGEPEEYSLRITLMSLLQCILSDSSFHSPEQIPGSKIGPTDFILSLVLPNLVWRAGGLASALRKLSVATAFSLLCHMEGVEIHSDILAQLIPVLHSCLEDTESSTRELACVCLSLTLEKSPSKMIQKIWESDARILDTLQPSLLGLLDDNHSPTRLAACRALKSILTLRAPSAKVISSLIVHLDDDDQEVKEQVHEVLHGLIELLLLSSKCGKCEKTRDCGATVLATAILSLKDALHTHRDGFYCNSLLRLVETNKIVG